MSALLKKKDDAMLSPAAPQANDTDALQARLIASQERQRKGRAASLLTGAGGLAAPPLIGQQTLLGGGQR